MLTLEGKDLAKFSGKIHQAKAQAVSTASRMSKPASYRRKLEKDATKKLDKVVKKLEARMNKLHRQLEAKDVEPAKFRKLMAAALRDAYLDAYMLGSLASGLARVSDLSARASEDEMKWLRETLKEEGEYFNKFLADIIKGASRTTVKNRIKNYSEAVRSVFESSKVIQLPDKSIIHWVLESRNPCPDCRLLHRLGPFVKDTLPTTPKAGNTTCFSHCYCKLRITQAKNLSEVDRIRKKNKSAEALLTKLKNNPLRKRKKK